MRRRAIHVTRGPLFLEFFATFGLAMNHAGLTLNPYFGLAMNHAGLTLNPYFGLAMTL
jgi:hypothetical protein